MKYDLDYITKSGDKQINEDAVSAFKANGIVVCILADGLGGFSAGEVASQFVVDSIQRNLSEKLEFSQECLEGAITKAHKELIDEQSKNPGNKNMSSTIVALMIKGHSAMYSYVGDSRLYLFKNKQIEFTTKDHSVCQVLVNAGELEYENIRFHEDKNKILRALGQENGFSIESGLLEFDPETDTFLLCSDGVWENLDSIALEIEYCKSSSIIQWLENIEARILRQAKDDMDNYSMIGIKNIGEIL